MVKRVFLDNRGRKRILPWGFHLVEDLVPLYQMRDDLKKKTLSKQAKLRLQCIIYIAWKIEKGYPKGKGNERSPKTCLT
ncbi:MAG: hypothetical protein LR000_02440 [Candidatus Pacebacteria bacterium]|nr:hypothetical protein [Candidatus Paceibacterota bacterium]